MKRKSAELANAAVAATIPHEKKSGATLKTIFDLPTDEIARQLTLVEFEIFSAIKVCLAHRCFRIHNSQFHNRSILNLLDNHGPKKRHITVHHISASLLIDSTL